MMKVLLLNGSARPRGCTYTALSEISQVLRDEKIETEILFLGDGPVRDCTGCRACAKLSGACVFDDDIVNVLLEKAREADGFVFGTPVYYAHPSGRILSVLDRAFYAGKSAFAHKPGAAIVSARRGGTTASVDVLNKYFTTWSTETPRRKCFRTRKACRSCETWAATWLGCCAAWKPAWLPASARPRRKPPPVPTSSAYPLCYKKCASAAVMQRRIFYFSQIRSCFFRSAWPWRILPAWRSALDIWRPFPAPRSPQPQGPWRRTSHWKASAPRSEGRF